MTLSNSQVTKLGDRLRDSNSSDDLTLLDEFRQTYSEVDERAYNIIQSALSPYDGRPWTSTKRKRKTQQSIVDKLHRQENLRLPQMQDIVGCRIVIQGGAQHAKDMNALLVDSFEQNQWQTDSKNRHADGYRAIHIIVKSDNMAAKKFYEIQLRTYAQDVWANLVESLSDEKNTLKYGGSEQEKLLMGRLKRFGDRLDGLDQQAHQVSFSDYQRQIEEVIRDVLSH